MNELVKKLIEVQRVLVAPKNNFNNFGKYKYRSAEDILEAVKPLNAQNGLLLTLTDEPILIGDWHYIKATASITDGTNEREVTAYARESESKKGMDHSQITGTASSYARKYALNGLYLIDDTKDADTDEHRNQTNKQQAPRKQQSNPTPKPKTASATQQSEIERKAKEYIKIQGTGTISALMEFLKISDIKLISENHAKVSIKKLDEIITAAKKKQEADTLKELQE